MHTWHSFDNNFDGSASDYTQKVWDGAEWGTGPGAVSWLSRLPGLTVLPYIFSHPLKASSLHPSPIHPHPQLIMDPLSHSICLPSHALKPNPFSLSSLFFLSLCFFFFIFSPWRPHTHTISRYFPSRVSYRGHGKCLCSVCACRDRQSKGRSAWSLQGDTGEERLAGIKY